MPRVFVATPVLGFCCCRNSKCFFGFFQTIKRWRLQGVVGEANRCGLGGRVGVSGPSTVPGPTLPLRRSYRFRRVEAIAPPGYRGSGPLGVTEPGGVAGPTGGRWAPTGPGRREVHLKTGVAR